MMLDTGFSILDSGYWLLDTGNNQEKPEN